MTDKATQDALDALNSLRVDTPNDFVRKHYDTIRSALSRQSVGDDVKEGGK